MKIKIHYSQRDRLSEEQKCYFVEVFTELGAYRIMVRDDDGALVVESKSGRLVQEPQRQNRICTRIVEG